MPKILYLITQGEYGGAQHYVLDLAQAFRERYEVVVAFGAIEKSQSFISHLESAHIRYEMIHELGREISLSEDWAAFKAIRQLIQEEKPDIIHLNSSKISVLGAFAALGSGAKVVYTAHGWVFNEKLDPKEKRKYVWLERLSARFKDMIICVSDFDRQSAINERICPESKLTVIHNGIPDFELLSREEARAMIETELDEPNLFIRHEFVIGSIGYLYKNKGFDFLINACKILIKEGHSPLLLIIGDGPEREDLENWIQQLGLRENVHLLGENQNAARLLRALDYYICSSVKEGLSYTVIEAMTAGLPIVATDVGGNAELIEDFKEGLIAKPGDAEELARDVLILHNDHAKALAMGQAAHKKAIKNFVIENMIQKTGYVYDNLLSRAAKITSNQ